MSEQLHDCPKCGTKNFTAKGLASHNCAKHAARRDAALAVDAGRGRPGSLPIQRDDAEMGVQLTSQDTAPAVPTPQTALATAMHLASMSPDDLAAASRMLADAEARYDRMSGICAVMNGLVLLEARTRVKHGQWAEWLTANFPKSAEIARYRIRIAEEFLASLSKGKSKSEPRFRFEATQMLFSDFAAQLAAEQAAPVDVENPVVAAVASWVDGRSFSALRDALPMADRGGWQGGRKKEKHTPEEEHAIFLAAAREDFTSALRALDALVMNGHWKSPSITDAELDAAMAVAERFAAEAKAWLKTPKKHRTRADAAGEEDGQ